MVQRKFDGEGCDDGGGVWNLKGPTMMSSKLGRKDGICVGGPVPVFNFDRYPNLSFDDVMPRLP